MTLEYTASEMRRRATERDAEVRRLEKEGLYS